MAQRSKHSYRRFSIGILGSAFFLLFVSLALNTTVNPLWVTPAPWTDSGFEDFKPIHKHPRTGKAGLAMKGDWDAVIIGSSRLDIALDPRDPLWKGDRVVNLGLRGGNLCEFAPMLQVAIEHNTLKTVILGLDHYDLISTVLISNLPSFQQSPLSEAPEPIERAIRYYIGGSTTTFAIKAINYRVKGRLASYDRLGQWVESLDERPFRVIYSQHSLPQAVQWIKRSKESLEAVPEKVEALRSIVDSCRRNNIRLVVMIPPNHATYLSNPFIADSPDPTYAANRRILFEVLEESDQAFPDSEPIAVWDFCDFHPLNCEALPPEGEPSEMKYWIDGTHATPLLGSLMLHCALKNEAAAAIGFNQPYGVRLSSRSLDQHTKSIYRGFESYKDNHPQDFLWAKDLYFEAVDKE